jgi:hypothetical protein
MAGTDPGPAPPGSHAPTPAETPPPLATREEREQFAIQALTDHFPGAVRRPLEYTQWDGRVSVEAELPGPRVVALFVEALRVQADTADPCGNATPPGCAEYPQPDGSVVMVVHHMEAGRVTVIANHMRTNGTHVQVGVSYDLVATAPYADEFVLVRAAMDPRLTAMAPGTGG